MLLLSLAGGKLDVSASLSNAVVLRLGSVSAQETKHPSVEYQRFTITKSKSSIRPAAAVHFVCKVIYMFAFVSGSVHQQGSV